MNKKEPERDGEENCLHPTHHTRRDFITKIGATTAGLLLGACSGSKLPTGPQNVNNSPAIPDPGHALNLPATSHQAAQVFIAKADSYDRQLIRTQIESMFNAMGGLSDIIRPGDKVGIKINMTGGVSSFWQNPWPPFELYLNHPEIVRAVIELAKDAGAGQVYILEAVYEDESWTYEDPASGLSYQGLSGYLGTELIDLNKNEPYADYVEREVRGGGIVYGSFTQNAILDNIDCFISLPKAKRHVSAGVTHSMKNLMGTLPMLQKYTKGATYRRVIHENTNGYDDLCRTLLDLNNATPIQLTVIDGVYTTVKGEGPWNQPGNQLTQVKFNTLIAAKNDMVAADSVATSLIGFDPMAADYTEPFTWQNDKCINYLRLASDRGMGTVDPAQIEVIDATVNTGVKLRP